MPSPLDGDPWHLATRRITERSRPEPFVILLRRCCLHPLRFTHSLCWRHSCTTADLEHSLTQTAPIRSAGSKKGHVKTFDDHLNVGRREMLHALGSVVAVGLAGCSGDPIGSLTSPTPGTTTPLSTNAACIVTPALTEGPYFVDERLNRSDIRTDPATGIARRGVPLTMTMRLSQISSTGACAPLVGALIDVWHCDALGVYSDISAQNSVGQKFLRGFQLSDANGAAQFTTIYPGWYMGRAVHIHFKVRTTPGSSSGLEFTSQTFFDDVLTDVVYTQAPYNTRGPRDTTNARDGIYQGGGGQVLLPLTASENAYAGVLQIGVRV